jgi:predicted nucleic acid-binding Zn ribbon protein
MRFELPCPACGQTTILAAPPQTSIWTCACGAEYELEPPASTATGPAVVAESAAVPAAAAETASAGKKSCPECGAFLPDANVLCTECGFNFRRGSKVPLAAGSESATLASLDPELLATEERRKQRIKLAVMGVLVLVVGAGLYWAFTAKDYGISGRHPMGKTAVLTQHFTGNMRLVMDGTPRPAPAAFGIPGTVATYKDAVLEKETNGRFLQTMAVAYDASHEICGVSGTFQVLSSAIPGGGISRISNFLKDYWEEVGAPVPPVFQRRTTGEGIFQHQEEVAEFTGPGVHAVWQRSGSDGMGLISSIDTITVARGNANPAALAAGDGLEEDVNAVGAGTVAPAAALPAPAAGTELPPE